VNIELRHLQAAWGIYHVLRKSIPLTVRRGFSPALKVPCLVIRMRKRWEEEYQPDDKLNPVHSSAETETEHSDHCIDEIRNIYPIVIRQIGADTKRYQR
jgi:hypothetical protein